MEYRNFREKFEAGLCDVNYLMGPGSVVTAAQLAPAAVKEPYRFLLDNSIPKRQKEYALRAVAEVANGNISDVYDYVFDGEKMDKTTSDIVSEGLEMSVESALVVLEDLLKEAESAGLDVRKEKEEVSTRRADYRDAVGSVNLLCFMVEDDIKDSSPEYSDRKSKDSGKTVM